MTNKYDCEALCKWPDGQVRNVMVMSNDGKEARVIWNEQVDSPEKAVTGFDETVPSDWLIFDRYPEPTCSDCGGPLQCRPGGGCLHDFDCPRCSPELFNE